MKTLFSSSRAAVSVPNRTFPRPPSKFAPLTSFQLPRIPNTRAVPCISFEVRTVPSPSPSLTTMDDVDNEEKKFDWYSQWYAVMPVGDLDRRRPHAKRVMGLDLVVWWDRNEGAWKVFNDMCPHRLAPLSEGRIDGMGRLQCVYHGWCFDGSGNCKFIPQAPADGALVHTSKRACITTYPTTVQHDIVWFWPNTDPRYKDVILRQKPPYIPELDDPSFMKQYVNRDFPYGYEVLMENIMDPAHVPYAHYGIRSIRQPNQRVKADREGGRPLDMQITKLDKEGFSGKHDRGISKLISPCVFYADFSILDPTMGSDPSVGHQNGQAAAAVAATDKRRAALIFICIPVSPGHSRLIWTRPRNFGVWTDQLIPRWMWHVGLNLLVDSDLYLLHVEERKIMEIGSSNWQKACFVPTKSDALVVGFRGWLNKYAGGQVDWRGKYSGDLPPTPPREQLMDRYWSHVVNCSSCSAAYKGLNALELTLQVLSVASIGILAATKQNAMSALARPALVMAAILFFVGSRWLAHFVYKNFRYHDYDHAFR